MLQKCKEQVDEFVWELTFAVIGETFAPLRSPAFSSLQPRTLNPPRLLKNPTLNPKTHTQSANPPRLLVHFLNPKTYTRSFKPLRVFKHSTLNPKNLHPEP